MSWLSTNTAFLFISCVEDEVVYVTYFACMSA